MTGRARQLTRRTVIVLAIGVLTVGAFLIGQGSAAKIDQVTTATPPPKATDLWRVKQTTVGRTLHFTGTLQRPIIDAPNTAAQGVVTSVNVNPSRPITDGTVLFTVDLQPVVAGQGPIPAFRTLAKGVKGQDVVQLRTFLCRLGILNSCTGRTFDDTLEQAVRTWHLSHGQEPVASISPGEILWFPMLPHRLTPASGFTRGTQVSPGQKVLSMIGKDVSLEVNVTRDQAALIPTAAKVHLGSTTGVVAKTESVGEDQMRMIITDPVTGKPLCSATTVCSKILGTATKLPQDVTIDVVPQASGLAVPVKALQSSADGATYVIDALGKHHSVPVTTQAAGMAVCKGLTAGMEIRTDEQPQ